MIQVVQTTSIVTIVYVSGIYFCRNRSTIVLPEISGNLTTDMNKLPTIRNKSSRCLGLAVASIARYTTPICRSTVCIRWFAPGKRSLDVTNFSTARTTPSFTRRPIAVLGASDTKDCCWCTLHCLLLYTHTQLEKVDHPVNVRKTCWARVYRRENTVVKVIARTDRSLDISRWPKQKLNWKREEPWYKAKQTGYGLKANFASCSRLDAQSD